MWLIEALFWFSIYRKTKKIERKIRRSVLEESVNNSDVEISEPGAIFLTIFFVFLLLVVFGIGALFSIY